MKESLGWNKDNLKDLLNKRNPVPFHPGSTVNNQGKQNKNIWGKLLASLYLSKDCDQDPKQDPEEQRYWH